MLDVDGMSLAGSILSVATRDLTNEEIGRMLIAYVPGACRWVVDYYNENSKKEEMDREDEKISPQEKLVEGSKAIIIVVSALHLLKDAWLEKVPWDDIGIKKIEEVEKKVVAMLSKEGGE